jgi:hypothetical protein
VEVEVMGRLAALAVACSLPLAALSAVAWAAEVRLGARSEIVHPGKGHEVHVSAPAVLGAPDGTVLLAWTAEEGADKNVYVSRAGEAGVKPPRVNPPGLTVEALHHSPLLAAGPDGILYVSWSSDRPRPAGVLFASDLRLSRSRDGGRSWDGHVRVNEDRAISHSFEGMAVTADGTVVMSWIDSRDGPEKASTWTARVLDGGSRPEPSARLDDETCVCCRVAVRGGPGDTVAVLWRKVFPGDVRDMVLGLSRDGGRTFARPVRVHDDGWKITGCPHRGGQVAMDGKGTVYAAWYTEGTQGVPVMLLASAPPTPDGRRFGAAKRVNTSTTTVPDQIRLAVNPSGGLLLVWEDATAVRRRILARASADGGRTLGPVQVLSRAIKAYMPDVAVLPDGDFVVAWHEEQFPSLKTVTQRVSVRGAGR